MLLKKEIQWLQYFWVRKQKKNNQTEMKNTFTLTIGGARKSKRKKNIKKAKNENSKEKEEMNE